MELFVALEVPFAAKLELSQVQKQCRKYESSGKYEPMENFHLTLRYIGEQFNVSKVIKHLDTITGSSFALSLGKLGMFNNKEGTVLWVDVQEEHHTRYLHELQKKVDLKLLEAGVQFEALSFIPHISVAHGCDLSIKEYFPYCKIAPVSFQVTMFHLYAVSYESGIQKFVKIKDFHFNQ